jgi:hypothetical protein
MAGVDIMMKRRLIPTDSFVIACPTFTAMSAVTANIARRVKEDMFV